MKIKAGSIQPHLAAPEAQSLTLESLPLSSPSPLDSLEIAPAPRLETWSVVPSPQPKVKKAWCRIYNIPLEQCTLPHNSNDIELREEE